MSPVLVELTGLSLADDEIETVPVKQGYMNQLNQQAITLDLTGVPLLVDFAK